MKLAPVDFVTTPLIERFGTNVVPFCRRPLMSETSSRGEGNIRQIIGETHAKVELVLRRMEEDRLEKREADQAAVLRWAASDRLHEQHAQRSLAQEAEIRRLNEAVTALQLPVQKIVELRGRIGWLGAVVVAGSLTVWAIAKPIYDGWISGWFRK